MKLSLKKDLTQLRKAANNRIDAAAAMTRMAHSTAVYGQELVYAVKRAEAEAVIAGASAGQAPHIAQEAQLNDVTLFDQAVRVLTAANDWTNKSVEIESIRMASKLVVATASNPAEIDLAMQDVLMG